MRRLRADLEEKQEPRAAMPSAEQFSSREYLDEGRDREADLDVGAEIGPSVEERPLRPSPR